MTAAEMNGRSGFVHDESDEDASEAQAQVIVSLRAQVTDLFSQVTQLNSKLVSSYDRVSDLEDHLHDASSSLRNASLTISSLELERSQHLAALNTGLLVEKAHVTAELNRLMERATEEAAQRGQAESARHDIEKDLDDLSATLFDQANTMVAEARLNQAKSERKVQDAEQALKIAEDAVKDMQVQMQVLRAEKEEAECNAREAKFTVRKGKWVEHNDSRVGQVPRIRFMTSHTPYAEFTAFVAHLRALRVLQPAPPVTSALLAQPFIARLLTEDSEPTVRLDLAPSLNWLSRRSVLAAIHSGMLTVEPLAFSSLVQELHQHPQSTSYSSLSCALCGSLIAKSPSVSPISRNHPNGSSWFKYPLALSSSQSHSADGQQSAECAPPGQVYIFRLAAAATSVPPPVITPGHTSSVSISGVGTSSRAPLNAITSSRVLQSQTQSSPYPLCASNYCLMRLRSTCSLWAFVRVGIIERIWEDEVARTPKPLSNGEAKASPQSTTTSQPSSGRNTPSGSEKPPVPPRRRRLWEMASALGERAVSWGKEGGENVKEKEKEAEKSGAKLPSPPPSHPSVPHPHSHAKSPVSRVDVQNPPPLPKRNVIRSMTTTESIAPRPGMQNGVNDLEITDSAAANPNGHPDSGKSGSNVSVSSTPLDEITFTAPLSEASLPPTETPHHVAAETGARTTEDHLPPLSPHTFPLPMTPTTPNAVSRVTSPIPRPRSRHSSPGSPPPSSRPISPAINRSRPESPVPATVTRTTSPPPGQPLLIRGKPPMSSPLASSRPASPAPATGPGAPPLPRRAAARRAVPPPPTSENPKAAGKECREAVLPVATDSTPEAETQKVSKAEVPIEPTNREGERGGSIVKETVISEVASTRADTDQTNLGPVNDVTAGDFSPPRSDVEGAVNNPSTAIHSDLPLPPASEGDSRKSVDSTRTKQSSNCEDEGFASDTTWEERTWKELVRLKEDMFWARIGGVRALQG